MVIKARSLGGLRTTATANNVAARLRPFLVVSKRYIRPDRRRYVLPDGYVIHAFAAGGSTSTVRWLVDRPDDTRVGQRRYLADAEQIMIDDRRTRLSRAA